MTTQNLKTVYLFILLPILFVACGLPKEFLPIVNNKPKEMVQLPIDYCQLFPSTTFDQWDNDYESYARFLTRDIMKTQMSLSYTIDSVHTWWCFPSALTHVQLDTSTLITDDKALIGNWRITCNRKISFEDSAVYADKKVYRTSKLVKDLNEDDVFLSMTANQFKLYAKEKGKSDFKKIAIRNYHIDSKRYVMLYGLSKSSASISFIGIDKEGRLIINSHNVEERKRLGIYIVYHATVTQLIFKKM